MFESDVPPTGLSLARAIRARKMSCVELTNAYLARIAELNPKVHAFVQILEGRAKRQAKAMEQALIRGKSTDLPIFFGVPNGIKDIDPMRGTWTRLGARLFRHLWTPFDGPVTRRIRNGGFVLLGKLATSEFAIMPITETDLHPPCRNPWNLDYTSGGSSGGSAAAVAAGMLPVAHASDGAGSIRIPAAFCHLYGIKPSRDLMPNFYGIADFAHLSTVNAVSFDVDDVAAMLDVMLMRSYDPDNPPPDSFLAQSQMTPPPLRIRFTVESPLCDIAPHIAEAVRKTAATLEALGHHVEEAPVLQAGLDEFLPLWMRMAASMPLPFESVLQLPTQWLRKQGRQYSTKEAKQMAGKLAQKVLEWSSGVDIWLTPTVPVPPPAIGAWRGPNNSFQGEEAFMSIVPLGSFTAIFNVSGQPAANIPAGIDENGLPYGVQVVAQPGKDALVFALSKQLEQAMPWRQRCAPLWKPI